MDAISNESKECDLAHYDTWTSPFLELSTPFTWWEGVKMAILGITFIPRVLLTIVSLSILALLNIIAAAGWPKDQPLPPSRYNIVRFASYFAGVPLFMLGFRIRVKGYENYKKAKELGAIGIFNHSAWADAILMMYLFAPSGVSKASNAEIPLIGLCIRAFQNIYVPDSKEARKGDWTGQPKMNLAKTIAERTRDRRYPMLTMAPEGTCGDGRCILQFKTGAFVAGVPIMPVLLKYNLKWHNPAWTIIIEPWHAFRLACQFDNAVDVLILPPYVPSAEEVAIPALFAANVRKLCAESLHLPLVEQSHREYRALLRAGVRVSWDGRKVLAPPGVLDSQGRYANLTLAEQPKDDAKKTD